jgi:class 3 adenylate cyclase
MFYIPETRLAEIGEHPLSLFTSLCRLAAEPDPVYREVKISAAFGQHAFELTFVEDTHDIYGKDIDLTNRLLAFAGAREIVMNAGLVERVKGVYSRLTAKDEYPEVEQIVGPWPQALKGFATQIPIFKVPAPHWA